MPGDIIAVRSCLGQAIVQYISAEEGKLQVPEKDMTNDEAAIRELMKTWFEATTNCDTATVLGLMSDDVVFMVPGIKPFGKETFSQSSEAMKGMNFSGTCEVVELKILGDWAWMRSFIRVTMTPPGGKVMGRSGYTLTILQKNATGRWQVTRDANLLATDTVS